MDKFSRSRSSREAPEMQPRNMNDMMRSYSTSDYNPPHQNNPDYTFREVKIKKSKIGSSSSSKSWSFDPELQRKKRVAGYKAYGVEGKMKNSFAKSFRWIKEACSNVVHGFR